MANAAVCNGRTSFTPFFEFLINFLHVAQPPPAKIFFCVSLSHRIFNRQFRRPSLFSRNRNPPRFNLDTQYEILDKINIYCSHHVLPRSPKNRRICQQKRCCQNRHPLLRRKVRQPCQGRTGRSYPCRMWSPQPRNGMVPRRSDARRPVSVILSIGMRSKLAHQSSFPRFLRNRRFGESFRKKASQKSRSTQGVVELN